MKKHFLLLIASIVILSLSKDRQCYAQFYSETIYTTKDGLKSNVIKYLIQTKDGHLWMINAGELCKFDGKDFTYYPLKNDIKAVWNDIELTELITGEIMLRSTQFAKFNPKTERFIYYTEPQKEALEITDNEGNVKGAVGSTSGVFDKNGNVWYANYKGVYKLFEGSCYNLFNKKDTIHFNNRTRKDNNGNIWWRSIDDELYQLNGEKVVKYNFEHYGFDTNNFIFRVKFITENGGVLFENDFTAGIEKEKWKWKRVDKQVYLLKRDGKLDTIPFLNENPINDVIERKNKLYFSSSSSDTLFVYDIENSKSKTIPLKYKVHKLTLYDNELILSSSSQNGPLSLLNEDNLLTPLQEFKQEFNKLITDIVGNIWMATDKGLVKYSKSTIDFEQIDFSSNLSLMEFQEAYSILDNDGNLWVATQLQMISSYNGYGEMTNEITQTSKLFKYNVANKTTKQFLPRHKDIRISWDSDNNTVWIAADDILYYAKNGIITKTNIVANCDTYYFKNGTCYGLNYNEYGFSEGISVLNNNKFKLISNPEGYGEIKHNYQSLLLAQPCNSCGPRIGVINKKTNKVDFILRFDSLEYEYPNAAIQDVYNNYWIFTAKNQKVYYSSPNLKIKKEKAYQNSGVRNSTDKTAADKSGNVWITSNMGLNFLTIDNDTIKSDLISKKQGLSSTIIKDLYVDDNNILWIATDNGVDKLDVNSYLESGTVSITHFGKKEGLKDVNCTKFVIRNKQLMVFTNSGYAIIDDSRKLTTLIAPNPYFTTLGYTVDGELKLDPRFLGEEVGFDNPFGPIYIGYNAIKFNNTKPLQYNAILYKSGKLLYGSFDNINWKTQEEIKYENLAPGNYKVELFCRVGAKGIKSEPTILEFKIIPAWWQTWWFKGLIILSVLAFLYLLFKWRTNALINRQKQLEKTVTEKTAEANQERDVAKEKTNEIIDSLNYAKRLQEAILPSPRLVKEWLTESFIFYKPKDIVAGDFYWMESVTNNSPLEGGKGDVEPTGQARNAHLIFFAAADCTGHGVPGAMVSVVCANALNRAVKEFRITDPGLILDKVSELVVEAFEKSDEEIKDGMDIALCALDMSRKVLYYSGAHNSLYRITKRVKGEELSPKVSITATHKLVEYKGTKRPIGAHFDDTKFTTQEIKLEPGDSIYLFSDGFADQFGGAKGKKLKYKPFRELLLENHEKPMEEQKTILSTVFDNWKGNLEQIDDVCIIGVKVNGIERNNFTKSELKVLACLQEGLSSKLIADKLNLSKNTINTYRRRLLAKTGTYNATELINYCVKKEII